MMIFKRLNEGEKYGFLTILEDIGKRGKSGEVYWKCQCDCGNIVIRSSDSIMQSVIGHHVISCGCKRDKSIGKRLANDPKRIELAVKSLGQIDGTTIQSISRKNLNKNNKSGIRGVSWDSKRQKWRVRVTLRNKEYGNKYFDDLKEAGEFRKYLEEEYFEPIKEKYRELEGK